MFRLSRRFATAAGLWPVGGSRNPAGPFSFEIYGRFDEFKVDERSQNSSWILSAYGPETQARWPACRSQRLTPCEDLGVVLPTVIRGMSRSNRSSKISDLELPGPGFSEDAPVVADVKVVAEHGSLSTSNSRVWKLRNSNTHPVWTIHLRPRGPIR